MNPGPHGTDLDMRTVRVYLVDAFTAQRGKGNRAGVVVSASELSKTEMQRVAVQVGASETAFFMKPSNELADIRLRWFAPESEVSLCGHATIAGFYCLARLKKIALDKSVHVETQSGVLSVQVAKRHRRYMVWFTLPLPRFRRMHPGSDLLESIGITSSDLHPSILPFRDDNHLYLALRKAATLQNLSPAMKRLAHVLRRLHVEGVSVFVPGCRRRFSAQFDGGKVTAQNFCSRFFAPGLGILEDPVTGSANGPIAAYLALLDAHKEARGGKSGPVGVESILYTGEQGVALGKPGYVFVRVAIDRGRLKNVTIGGFAVSAGERILRL